MSGASITAWALVLAFPVLAGGCMSGQKRYMCLSRQAEAKASLKSVHTAETAYKAGHAKFGSSLTEIGFTPATARYYDVKIDSASDTAFSATATGKDQSSGDVWSIDQTGTVVAKVDKCHE